MVQSNLPKGRTRSGRIDARVYLNRLKSASTNRSSSFAKTNKQTRPTDKSVNDINSKLFHSISSQSTFDKYSSFINETDNEEPQDDRSSSSARALVVRRPPSSPIDIRCSRVNSSHVRSISREHCSLLGPELCSDCLELKSKSDSLFHSRISSTQLERRLSSLSIRRFVQNQDLYSDEELQQRIPFLGNKRMRHNTNEHLSTDDFIDDDIYFDRLSNSIRDGARSSQLCFVNLRQLESKHRQSTEPIRLHDNPSIESSNHVYRSVKENLFSVDQIRPSNEQRSIRVDANLLRIDRPVFISTRKSNRFYAENKFIFKQRSSDDRVDVRPEPRKRTLIGTILSNRSNFIS